MLKNLRKAGRIRLPWSKSRQKEAAKVPKINLVPPEYLTKPLLNLNRVMFLIVIFEVLIALLLLRTYGDNTSDAIQRFAGGSTILSPEVVRAEGLTTQINNFKARINRLNSAESQFKSLDFAWPDLLRTIFDEAPPGIEVFSFREISGDLALAGEAGSSDDVIAFSNHLQKSPNIATVNVQGIGGQGASNIIDFIFLLKLKSGSKE